jgi:hypothetical protein
MSNANYIAQSTINMYITKLIALVTVTYTVGFKIGGTCTSVKALKSPSKWGELAIFTIDFMPRVGQKNSPTADVTNTRIVQYLLKLKFHL